MKISIEKIAALAGVSTGTISRVLNNRSGVSEETARRVREIMDEHGYTPRFTTGEQSTIGVAVRMYERMFDSFYVSNLMSGILNASFGANYDVKILSYQSIQRSGLNFKTAMRMKNITGILLLGSHQDTGIVDSLSDTEVPSVVIGNRCANRPGVSWIDIDHERGMSAAILHLLGLGHKNITFVGFSPLVPSQGIRLSAFKECMNRYLGLTEPDAIFAKSSSYEDGFQAIHDIMVNRSADRRPSALVVTNENLCLYMMEAARKLGIVVPDDLSILCLGQSPMFSLTTPLVTSVEADIVEMGHRSVRSLIELMSRTRKEPARQIMPIELKDRQSCRRVSADQFSVRGKDF